MESEVYFPEYLPKGLSFGSLFIDTPNKEECTYIDLYQLGGGDTSSSDACGYFRRNGKKIKNPAETTLHRIEDGKVHENTLKEGEDYFIIYLGWSYVLRYKGVDFVTFPGIIDRVGGFINHKHV